jgi:hypothetical protein
VRVVVKKAICIKTISFYNWLLIRKTKSAAYETLKLILFWVLLWFLGGCGNAQRH